MAHPKKGFFLYIAWYYGLEQFKRYGAHYMPVRPPSLPKKIPLKWILRRKAWALKNRKQLKKPPQVVKPNPPTTVELEKQTAVWDEKGVYTYVLGNYHDGLRHKDRAKGYTVMYVLLAGDPSADANRNNLLQYYHKYVSEGWKIVGWSPAYHGGPDAIRDKTIINDFAAQGKGLHGWATNQENWAEGQGAWITAQYALYWNQSVPLAWSVLSSKTGSFARSFDYAKALSVKGSSIQPQVYGNVDPAYTIEACLATMDKGKVPRRNLNITIGTYGTSIPWNDYYTWKGPITLYTADQLEESLHLKLP